MRQPTHPGEVLREDVLPSLGISKSKFADLLHISRQMLHRILNGEAPISTDIAVKLGVVLGNGPTLWLNMQRNYDLYRSEQDQEPILKELLKNPEIIAIRKKHAA